MMPDNYTKQEANEDFRDIKEHIKDEKLDDVLEHYEVASRLKYVKSKGHYRDLLSRLVRTYGH